MEEQACQHHSQSEIVRVVSDAHSVLYGAELWPLTDAQKKKLEAAHHKFQKRMMGISWKDKVSNERVRAQTQLEKTEMARTRSANGRHQLDCQDKLCTGIIGSKRKPGRPQKNWIDTIQQDLKSIGMTRKVARCRQRRLASMCGPVCL